MSLADEIPSTGNSVLDELLRIMVSRFEHLVERGFLAPHFLNKMVSDPQEILKFLRQNRAVVGDQLNRRLDPTIRPTPQQLEAKGIVPVGYFSAGHEKAIAKKHRRRSTAGQDLAMMIQLRPKPEQVIKKGIMTKSSMNNYYESNVAANHASMANTGGGGIGDDMKLIDILTEEDEFPSEEDATANGPWEISILSTLLFKTISEALRKSCLDTQSQENAVLTEMEEMNAEMKSLRDALDKYFLSDAPDISLFQQEEDMVREKFHGIQQKLLHISTRQNRIHEKLRILHSVERSMVELQNNYDQQLGKLRKTEEEVLKDLREQKIRRDKALMIMLSERSHQDWATAKLHYTISVAREYNQDFNATSEDVQFVNELDKFLNDLYGIAQHQKQIVSDFDACIDELESSLLSIRHDMSKVRTLTFKKIYDLHKQVQIAESIELGLGNRRLSVASATEIERERRHHSTKIQRQLLTLNNNIMEFNYNLHEKNLREIADIQHAMSDRKLKSFFSVFISTFNQTICDVELMYKNLNHNSNSNKLNNGTTTTDHYIKITNLCQSLYGINSVIMKITNNKMTLNDKLTKCIKFIQNLKDSILREYKIEKIATFRVNIIVVMIARKLCCNEHMIDEIEKTHDQQIPRLAEIRSKDIFETVINGQRIFSKHKQKKPKNSKQCASILLEQVFGIKSNYHQNNPFQPDS